VCVCINTNIYINTLPRWETDILVSEESISQADFSTCWIR